MNKGVGIFILYLLFFLVYFAQYPINGSLPGNLDTWWCIHVFEQLNFTQLFKEANHCGMAGYPDGNLLFLGDVSLLTSFLFNLIHLFFNNKITAYYILVSLIFSLNSFGMFTCSKHFFKKTGIHFFTGLIFGAAPFFIGGIDNVGVITVYPITFSFYFFLNYLQQNKNIDLVWFTICAILQIFSGYYYFILGGLILFLDKSARIKCISVNRYSLFASALILMVFSAFAMFYNFKITELSAKNPIDVFNEETIRLLPEDLSRPLSNNLLYNQVPVRENFEVLNGIHSLFMGYLVWLLALVAIVKSRSVHKSALLLLLFLGVVLALGASVQILGVTYKMPLYYVYKYFNSGILRISIRAFFISHVALCVLAGLGLQVVSTYVRTSLQYLLFPAIFIVECLAFPLPTYNSQPYLNISNEYQEVINNHSSQSIQTILDLPSSLYSDVCLTNDLYSYSIDFIYTNWQTQHHQNTLNGRAGFIPSNRLVVDSLVQKIDSPESIVKLINDYDLTMVSVHKWLMCDTNNMGLYRQLLETDELEVVLDSDSMLVLIVKN